MKDKKKSIPETLHKIGEKLERSYILIMLDSENWDLEKTAFQLRMDVNILEEKMKKYGIKQND